MLWETGQLGRDDKYVERAGFRVDVAIPKPKERSTKIALRIDIEDLEAIRIIATEEGLRYQTYIKSVLKKEILSRRRAGKKI